MMRFWALQDQVNAYVMQRDQVVDHPYRAQYALSDRSKCRRCRSNIGGGELRIAEMALFYGRRTEHWFHVNCFFIKHKPKALGDIAGVYGLEKKDRAAIEARIIVESSSSDETASSTDESDDDNDSDSDGPSAATSKPCTAQSDKAVAFKIEYAASSGVSCQACQQKINKGNLRCIKRNKKPDEGSSVDVPRFYHYHLKCFAECRGDTKFWDTGYALSGYRKLREEDKKAVVKVLPRVKPARKMPTKQGLSPAKKIKIDKAAAAKQQPLKKQGGIKVLYPNKPLPLEGMNFAVQGRLVSMTLNELKIKFIQLGAEVVTNVDKQTMAVISDQISVAKKSTKKIKDAKMYGVHVVPEEFIQEAKLLTTNDEVVALVKKLAISPWGNDPTTRLPAKE